MYAVPLLVLMLVCFAVCYVVGLKISVRDRRIGRRWLLVGLVFYAAAMTLFMNRPATEWRRDWICGDVTLTHDAKHPHVMRVSLTKVFSPDGGGYRPFEASLGDKVLLIPDATHEKYVMIEVSRPRRWYQAGVPSLFPAEVHVSPQDLMIVGGATDAR